MCKSLVPHKWADVIHAWADGATVQWRTIYEDTWHDVRGAPSFYTSQYEYRVKPIPITKEQARVALDNVYTSNYPPRGADMKLVWDFLHQDD